MVRYNGPISIEEIASGIEATIKNMEGLVAAAHTLVAAGSYGPAFGLSVMSLEEAGKLHALRAMAQRGAIPGMKWRQLWSAFRNHNYKSSAGFMDCYSDETRANSDQIMELALQHEATAGLVESARQWSFYVDFDSETRDWNTPVEFDQRQTVEVLAQAEVALQRAQNHLAAGLFSVEALELLRIVYEPFFRELLVKDGPVSLSELASGAVPYYQEWWARLSAAGIPDPLSGVRPLL